jgi:phasin family protein
MTDFSEQFQEFAKLQSEFLAPLREMSSLAVDSFESLSRLNYSVQGDLIDYSIEQAQLVVSADNVASLMSKQYETAKAFGEKISARASEYSDLAKEYQASIQKIEIAPAFEAPIQATAKAAKKATAAAA